MNYRVLKAEKGSAMKPVLGEYEPLHLVAEPQQVGTYEVITRLEAQNLSCELNITLVLWITVCWQPRTKGNETCKGEYEPHHLVAKPLQGRKNEVITRLEAQNLSRERNGNTRITNYCVLTAKKGSVIKPVKANMNHLIMAEPQQGGEEWGNHPSWTSEWVAFHKQVELLAKTRILFWIKEISPCEGTTKWGETCGNMHVKMHRKQIQ